ncbi:protein of unknown function [Roseivivax marinus]|uniref:HamA C-terminal domain-containing protein n=1 Tax=Roseivivax TaxID=93682 RepID=UPI0008C1D5F4|nr:MULTISPECIES: DUF1837 domain-containing protein [Roseivivax]QFT46714.1 hypothetical protein FIU97_09035 [Roseivivax sp. THAF40]SEK80722.1 protein of unknown function [Roseivivax marinus]
MNEETKIEDAPLDLATLLTQTLRTGGKVTDTHLVELTPAQVIEDTATEVHCYRLPIDAHGRVRFKPLAEFLRARIVDYAIPRKRIEEAKNSFNDTGSSALILKLEKEAEALFTSLAKSGEGGELLVFAFAESVFGMSQVISKMSLKTSTEMHYHGADGVYAKGTDDGGLKVYWGESKLYGVASDAVRDCLNSLAPFLADTDGADSSRAQDVFLINEFANFDDPKLTEGLKNYFDQDKKESLSLHHCGIALVGFDSASYLEDGQNLDEKALEAALQQEVPGWTKQIKNRVGKEAITSFEISFICVPMRTIEEFRSYFLSLLGQKA